MINYLALHQDHRFVDGADYILLSDQSDSSDSDISELSDFSLSNDDVLDGPIEFAKESSDEACKEQPPSNSNGNSQELSLIELNAAQRP